VSDPAIQSLIREVLAEELAKLKPSGPAEGAGARQETVAIASSADLQAFAASVAERAADPALAAVNGDDALPDVAIGRLPASDADELRQMVAKILAYEREPQPQDAPIVLVTDDADNAGDFRANAREIVNELLDGRPEHQQKDHVPEDVHEPAVEKGGTDQLVNMEIQTPHRPPVHKLFRSIGVSTAQQQHQHKDAHIQGDQHMRHDGVAFVGWVCAQRDQHRAMVRPTKRGCL